jgi:hypothetical protein
MPEVKTLGRASCVFALKIDDFSKRVIPWD